MVIVAGVIAVDAIAAAVIAIVMASAILAEAAVGVLRMVHRIAQIAMIVRAIRSKTGHINRTRNRDSRVRIVRSNRLARKRKCRHRHSHRRSCSRILLAASRNNHNPAWGSPA